jgi:hypothetical protein
MTLVAAGSRRAVEFLDQVVSFRLYGGNDLV